MITVRMLTNQPISSSKFLHSTSTTCGISTELRILSVATLWACYRSYVLKFWSINQSINQSINALLNSWPERNWVHIENIKHNIKTIDENYPENVAPTGPILRIRVARDSPSFSGGGCDSFSRFTSLQVMRVGAQARPGGTITRMPEWRQPRIAPPRASTTKLTRNLQHTHTQTSKSAQCFQTSEVAYIENN